jgi:anti-anti-sigma factor
MHVRANPDGLTYFLSEKHRILVVSLVGPLTRANSETLQQCIQDIQKTTAQSVVINLHDVSTMDKSVVPDFMKLQLLVRKKPAELRICFVQPKIRMFLDDAGVLRPAEVSSDLKEALVSLPLRRAA